LFFLAVVPFEAVDGDGFVEFEGVDIEFDADCNDGAGVNVC